MRPIPCTLPAASGGLITGSGYIVYWSALETTGNAAAGFQLIDGNDANGQLLIDVSLSAGESTSEYIGKRLLFYTKSLYFDLVSGAVGGAVTVHACESSEEYQKMMAELSLLKTFLGSGP